MFHRTLLHACLLFAGTALFAKELPVTTTINAVKVFLSGAEVTRLGKMNLPIGTSTLVFAGLSEEVDPDNIQVTGQGAFTILSVTHRLNYLEEKQDRKEVKDLEEKIAAVEAEIAREQALFGVLVKEEERLAKNDVVGGDKGATLEQLRATNDYMQQRLEAIALSQLAKQARIKELNEGLTKQRLQLTQLKGKKPAPTSEVAVEVTCTSPVEAKLTLKYLVRSAGWSPSYDIRVSDISQPLDLTYKALVYQNTGEEWKDVTLSLSSGDPNKGARMPMLSTWLLDFGARTRPTAIREQRSYKPGIRDVRGIVRDERTGEPLPFVNVQLVDANGNMINGTTTNFDGYYAIAIPDGGHELRFSYLGYKTQGTPVFAGTINQALTPQQTELNELVISERRMESVAKLSPSSIESMPSLGYSDNAQYLSVAPGVINNRGGRISDEAYYVDGVKVATGGTPANYGNSATTSMGENVIERATNFEFAIKVPYTIPSDGQNHNVGVQEQKLNAQYRYYCTPKLDLDAFLFAKVTDWEALNLLPGPAHIYFEGTYVGESELDLSTVGDTLDLSLGRDQGVSVQRTKRKDFSQKQMGGSKRTDSISWELAVRNNKGQAVQLIITDQYPVAARSEIEVELLESSGAQVNKEKGFITWKKTLEPRTNQTWNFTYSVKYPKEGVVWLE